jgi:hypothetical protein
MADTRMGRYSKKQAQEPLAETLGTDSLGSARSDSAEDLKRRNFAWPYPVAYGKETEVDCDVLVVGGGVAGCWAAIGAARRGLKVALVEKGSTIHSGSAGSGIDH